LSDNKQEKMVVSEPQPGIAVLKMNDVEGKNIFSEDFIHNFLHAMDKVENEIQPRVMILQGLEDVFCGGADKDTLVNLCDGKIVVKDLVLSERLVNTEFPVIAAAEGHGMGGGLAMALCCDVVIFALESRYGAVFMNMGFTPGMGTTVLLSELVGPYIANEMMFTGKRFRGKELAKMGTSINYILPKSEVMKKGMDIALQIAEKNVKSLHILKYTLGMKKRDLLNHARMQEDLMHRISFGFPETKQTISEFYVE
jgi:polyketide biosynthesis enoyl-CoA hydratase PksI